VKDVDLIHYMWDSPHQILVKTVINFPNFYMVGKQKRGWGFVKNTTKWFPSLLRIW